MIERLKEIPVADWNRLAGVDNPFLRHESPAPERRGVEYHMDEPRAHAPFKRLAG